PAYHGSSLSFPTRRSSDLGAGGPWYAGQGVRGDVSGDGVEVGVVLVAGGEVGGEGFGGGLHGGLLALARVAAGEVEAARGLPREDRKSTRLNSSHVKISYA